MLFCRRWLCWPSLDEIHPPYCAQWLTTCRSACRSVCLSNVLQEVVLLTSTTLGGTLHTVPSDRPHVYLLVCLAPSTQCPVTDHVPVCLSALQEVALLTSIQEVAGSGPASAQAHGDEGGGFLQGVLHLPGRLRNIFSEWLSWLSPLHCA